MSSTRTTRRVAVAATSVVAAVLLAAIGIVTAPAGMAAAPPCGVLFDDFHYTSPSDPAISQRGWIVRTNQGGPGVPGAQWPASNVSFPTVDGQRTLRLRAATDGTVGGTSNAEFFHQQKFHEGTYAARVRFSDTPASGNDGDHIVQTFFTITPLHFDLDPNYAELDFEYLPNGGWGEQGPIMYQVSWNTYRNEPWFADNVHTSQRTSFDGWQDLLIQVADGRVRYFINGAQVAEHGGQYYPPTPMSINFNLWFIDLTGHTGGLSTYLQDVEWVYFSQNEVVSPTEVASRVSGYRSGGVTHTDTVGSASDCPAPPTGTPTASPTATPTTPPGPVDCANAPAWSWSTAYQQGQRVTHERSAHGDPSGPPSGDGVHLWQARWWTQGSEPGWTPQWENLGRC